MSKVSQKKSSKGKVVENALSVWDFTVFNIITPKELRDKLKEFCKKYAFQLEECPETEKKHYQGRISLKVKERKSGVIKRFEGLKAHISMTSTANRDNMFYVLKDDSRLAGPFTDENEVFIPEDVEEIVKLRPWQNTMRENLLTKDKRCIDIIIDIAGNKGKTTLSRYMMCYDKAEIIPMVNDFKDVMRMAFAFREAKIFFIDMPRAIEKGKLRQLYGAIETIKSGYVFDDRYTMRRALIYPPRICVFTNEEPQLGYLSIDRWRMWAIDHKDRLIKYIPKGGFLDATL